MTDLMITAPEGYVVSVLPNDDSDTVMVHDKTSGDRVSQCRFAGRVTNVFPGKKSLKVWVKQGEFLYYAEFRADRRKPTEYIATTSNKEKDLDDE